ncbi:hypothetical protein CC2G_011112 [Coprinopsis cinerea AmutBmut pab1-1]|nr:hypothetical protein CC2G_011112 [Coprinopsis cinerea AmutBmut pab1-1]
MSLRNLDVKPYQLAPDADYPLFVTAKCYRLQHEGSAKGKEREQFKAESLSADGLTLIVLHSTSFHKETWEATLETLFNVNARGRDSSRIQEAWVIESPNHGESAALNEHQFLQPEFATEFGCHGYARAVHRFLQRGPVRFSNRKLVGVGHSLGANTITLLQDLLTNGDGLRFSSLILIEPMVSPEGIPHLRPLRDILVAAARKRPDTWLTQDDLRRYLKGRKNASGKWDERVIDAFVKFGVRQRRDQSWTLACTRQQEEAMYLDTRGPVDPIPVLDRISAHIPIHLVLGGVKDFIPAHVHEALTSPTSARTYASVTTMPNVGHLIVQEQPDALATTIQTILDRGTIHRPKL